MVHHFFKHRLNDFSIKYQLELIILPFMVMLTVIIGGILVFNSSQQLDTSYRNLSRTDAQHTRSVIFEVTSNFTKYANHLTTDARTREILSNDYSDIDTAKATLYGYQHLDYLRKQDTAIRNIKIYTDNPNIPNYKDFISLTSNHKKSSWYQKAMQQSNSFWVTKRGNEKNQIYLTIYQQIPLPLSPYTALVEIELDYNYLKNNLAQTTYQGQVALNDDPIFYSDSLSEVETSPIALSKKSFDSSVQTKYLDFHNKSSLIAYSSITLSNQDDTLYIYSINQEASRAIWDNIWKWSSLLLFVLLLAIFLTLYFSNFFTKRIKQLQEAVYRASIQDYKFFHDIDGKDEISHISLYFHRIIQQIQKKEEKIYQSQLLEQELLNQQQKMEFSVLASQINPHFLFNTLETIRMTALQHQDRDVANAIKLLSKSMRYTLSNHGIELTTLQKELDAITVYTQIQQLRFGDRVQFHSQVSDELVPEDIHILPLLIQPLVENAISHGLEGKTENGQVHLMVKKNARGELLITVSDNGLGIPPTKLHKLRQMIDTNDISDTHHIGLKNVHNRMRQYYGEQYGLTIISQEGQGTRVQLCFPIN